MPDPIANSLRNILSITQDGSHSGRVMQYVEEIKSPYLFKSILFQLFEVIVWFKDYVDSNPIKETMR